MPTVLSTSSDNSIDAFSEADFVKKTGNMKGTLGDMENLSREMSEKRAAKNGGEDPVLNQMENQKMAATGLDSFRRKKKKATESLAKKGIILE